MLTAGGRSAHHFVFTHQHLISILCSKNVVGPNFVMFTVFSAEACTDWKLDKKTCDLYSLWDLKRIFYFKDRACQCLSHACKDVQLFLIESTKDLPVECCQDWRCDSVPWPWLSGWGDCALTSHPHPGSACSGTVEYARDRNGSCCFTLGYWQYRALGCKVDLKGN